MIFLYYYSRNQCDIFKSIITKKSVKKCRGWPGSTVSKPATLVALHPLFDPVRKIREKVDASLRLYLVDGRAISEPLPFSDRPVRHPERYRFHPFGIQNDFIPVCGHHDFMPLALSDPFRVGIEPHACDDVEPPVALQPFPDGAFEVLPSDTIELWMLRGDVGHQKSLRLPDDVFTVGQGVGKKMPPVVAAFGVIGGFDAVTFWHAPVVEEAAVPFASAGSLFVRHGVTAPQRGVCRVVVAADVGAVDKCLVAFECSVRHVDTVGNMLLDEFRVGCTVVVEAVGRFGEKRQSECNQNQKLQRDPFRLV